MDFHAESSPDHLRLRGWKLIDRVALAFLLFCAIFLVPPRACSSFTQAPAEIRRLETYRPNVVTEVYADDGQLVGSFALHAVSSMTYEQCPKTLFNAVTSIEDQHFESTGASIFRASPGPWSATSSSRITAGASTISMQLAGNLSSIAATVPFAERFRNASRASNRAPLHQPQIFTMYANQVYLGAWQLRFRGRRSVFNFGKSVTD